MSRVVKGGFTAGAARAAENIAGQGVCIISKKTLIRLPLSFTDSIKILKQKPGFCDVFEKKMLHEQMNKFGVINNDNF